MATTRIMPLHIGKGRTESQAVSDIIDYVSNPQKTDNGRLVTGFACDSRVADAEFLLAKREYISTTAGDGARTMYLPTMSGSPLSPARLPRKKPTGWAWSLQSGSPRAITPLWSAPISTSPISIITSSGTRSM